MVEAAVAAAVVVVAVVVLAAAQVPVCVLCHLESALWFEIDLTESGCCHCCHSYLT